MDSGHALGCVGQHDCLHDFDARVLFHGSVRAEASRSRTGEQRHDRDVVAHVRGHLWEVDRSRLLNWRGSRTLQNVVLVVCWKLTVGGGLPQPFGSRPLHHGATASKRHSTIVAGVSGDRVGVVLSV